jgi:hypothetical protein
LSAGCGCLGPWNIGTKSSVKRYSSGRRRDPITCFVVVAAGIQVSMVRFSSAAAVSASLARVYRAVTSIEDLRDDREVVALLPQDRAPGVPQVVGSGVDAGVGGDLPDDVAQAAIAEPVAAPAQEHRPLGRPQPAATRRGR